MPSDGLRRYSCLLAPIGWKQSQQNRPVIKFGPAERLPSHSERSGCSTKVLCLQCRHRAMASDCDSHPKMLYRVTAIYRSVTEADVFPPLTVVFPLLTVINAELRGFESMLDQRADASPYSVPDPTRQVRPSNPFEPSSSTLSLGDRSTIGKSLLIKGEITGSESLYIEGTVEGSVNLPDDRVTVGRDGRVSANIAAREIVVLGEVVGSCEASDHFDIRSKGSVCGDIVVSRISVEDGAFLTGSIDIRQESAPEAVEHEQVEFSQVN